MSDINSPVAKEKSKENRDAADEKIMAVSPGNEPGRVIDASLSTLNNTPNSPINAYYEFPSSKVESKDTYSKRIDKLSEILGCKDTVKG